LQKLNLLKLLSSTAARRDRAQKPLYTQDMERIPPNGDEPEIWLFERASDLREQLGHAQTHGMYDPKENRIYATWKSLPHEIAHFKDFKSGKMKKVSEIKNPEQKKEAQLRNEILAVIYAWQKKQDLDAFLTHEKEFLECLYYMIEKKLLEIDRELEKLSFKELQNLAEKVATKENPLFEKIEALFAHYLDKGEATYG